MGLFVNFYCWTWVWGNLFIHGDVDSLSTWLFFSALLFSQFVLSGALLLHCFSSKGHGRSSAEAWSHFTVACWVLGKATSWSPERICFCASLSHLEGLSQMNAQDTLAGCSLMLAPCYCLHQFGSKTGRFGVDGKIRYSSFITVLCIPGYLQWHNTSHFVSVHLKAQMHRHWYLRMIFFLSEQQADLRRLKSATAALKAVSVNTAKAQDAFTLSNISWEVCFSFSFLRVLPGPQWCTCLGKHHHQIQGCRRVLPACWSPSHAPPKDYSSSLDAVAGGWGNCDQISLHHTVRGTGLGGRGRSSLSRCNKFVRTR